MRNLSMNIAAGLALLALCSSPILAETPLDPMKPLMGRPAGPDPLDPMSALRVSATANATAGNDEFGGLPDAVGAEETYYQCVACHSTEIIKQQRVSDHRWDELWTWMVDKQGMIEPDEETRKIILTYLKTNLSSER